MRHSTGKKFSLLILMTCLFTMVYADPTPTFTPVTGVNSLIHKIAFDGDVLALTTTADAVYAGGNFQWVGPVTGCGVLLNGADGALMPGMPPVADGYIKQIISDGAGGLYICGTFNYVAGLSRKYLAHIYSNGSLDPLFLPAPNANVNTIVLSNGFIFAGGDFSIIGGQTRNRIAKLDAATGAADAAFNPNSNNTVNTLAADASGNIYAGGTFSVIGTRSRYYLAKINASTGIADIAFNPSPNWAITYLYTDSNSGLYVCGGFSSIALYTRSYIAKFDTSTGSIVTGFNPAPNTVVDTIVSDGSGNLFLGGQFTSVSGTARNYMAKISALNGALDPVFNPDADNSVSALCIGSGGAVYAGGKFMSAGGLDRYRIAKIDSVTGAVDNGFNKGMNGPVYSLSAEGTNIYAGGDFTGYGIEHRPYLLALDLSGNIIPGFNPVPNKTVNALAIDPSGALAAGGFFTDIGGLPRNYVAKLDRYTGTADAGFNASISGTAVSAIAFDGAGNEYIGGKFSLAGGAARNNIVKVNAVTGAYDTAFNANANNTVNAICLDGTDIYLGGTFTGVSSTARPYLAKANSATGVVYTTFTAAYLGGAVTCLALGESSAIYAGGVFNGGLVKFDKITGANDTSFAPSCDGSIYAIKTDMSGSIYAGGFFTFIGSDFRKKIAKLNAFNGFADPGFYQSSNNTVNAIAISAAMDVLHAGGAFTSMSGLPAGKYAAFGIMVPFTLTPTMSATISPTFSVSPTSTLTATMTPTMTQTVTGSETSTATITATYSETATITPTSTITVTYTDTPTITETCTHTITMTQTDTYSETPTFTETLIVSLTHTPTLTESFTPEDTASMTATLTQTITFTETPTFTSTESNTPVVTQTVSFTWTLTSTLTLVPSQTQTPTVTFTASHSAESTATGVYTATMTQTLTAGATPTLTPTIQPGTESPWLDYNNEKNIVPYPNPSSGSMNIYLKYGHEGDKVIVSIYTINLRLIQRKEYEAVAANNYAADLSRFSNGLYLAKIVILKAGKTVYQGVREIVILR